MKLTMKDEYSFQRTIGYPEDPEMMSQEDVKAELARWAYVIGSWMEDYPVRIEDILGLDGFLSALAHGEIEYTAPTKKIYHVQVRKVMTITAANKVDALEIAATHAGEPGFDLEIVDAYGD